MEPTKKFDDNVFRLKLIVLPIASLIIQVLKGRKGNSVHKPNNCLSILNTNVGPKEVQFRQLLLLSKHFVSE
jgi:hypothetical protein